MIIYVISILMLFYALFYKEIWSSYHILFIIFVIRLIFILIYYYDDTYVGLLDDFSYYRHGKALLIFTPEQLLGDAINQLYMVSNGFHILYNFLNFIVYDFFGDNIMNMLLFNLVCFTIAGYFCKKISSEVFISSKYVTAFCLIFFSYPDMWGFGYFNLKEFVLTLLVSVQIYFTLAIGEPNGNLKKCFYGVLIALAVWLTYYIRFYMIFLYIASVISWIAYKRYNWKFHKIQFMFIIVYLLFIKGYYDFALSPFFLTVNDDYKFLQIPSFINLFFLFPILFLGLIKSININNPKMMLLLIYLNYTFTFFAILGFSVGIAGPRQRIFIEFIYVLLIVYGLKVIQNRTNIVGIFRNNV